MRLIAHHRFSGRLVLLAALAAPVLLPAVDIVHRRSSAQREGGTISNMSKTEVTVTKQVGAPATVPVNDIASIDWDGAPSGLGLGASAINSGNLDYARQQLDQAKTEAAGSNKAGLKGDIDFQQARLSVVRAQADRSQTDEARGRLQAFLRTYPNHYRGYEAQLLLGDVSLAAGDYGAAAAAYRDVATAPWKDFQMAAQLGHARVLLAQGETDQAREQFDAVAAVAPENAAQKKRRFEALLGQARCLHLQQQYDAAIHVLNDLIDGATVEDTRLQAEAYLRQGDCYVAGGADPKEAIMAYLHVDVIPAFAREQDLHAEALYNLSRLWGQAGHPERAGEAAEALRTEHPGSEWAKKLGG